MPRHRDSPSRPDPEKRPSPWLSVAAVGLVYYLAARSLPDYDATVPVAGVTAPVEIVRDNANVPHIFGETETDVFFGWAMPMRRTGCGRCGDAAHRAGPPVRGVRRRRSRSTRCCAGFGLYAGAQHRSSVQDARAQAALRPMPPGSTPACARSTPRRAGSRRARDVPVRRAPIAPWQPADSIAMIKLMAVQLAGHLEEEVLRARTSLTLEDAGAAAPISCRSARVGHRRLARIRSALSVA
jgi:penicillin amidase